MADSTNASDSGASAPSKRFAVISKTVRSFRKLDKWLQFVLTIVTAGTVLLGVWGWISRKVSNPKAVFVVLPHIATFDATPREGNGVINLPSDPTAVSKDLWQGIVLGGKPRGTKVQIDLTPGNGVPPETIEIVPIDDGPDAADTILRIRQAQEKYNCLLILGHETSTLAKGVWRDFYKTAKTPVVLLGPTNPAITVDDLASESKVLLRLLPTDDQQMIRLREILEGTHSRDGASAAHRVMLVVDKSNPVYANYIAQGVLKNLPEGAHFLGSVEVSTASSMIADLSRLERMEPTMVIFVGMSEAAQGFVQSLEEEWRLSTELEPSARRTSMVEGVVSDQTSRKSRCAKMDLVFTDGCATGDFCEFLRRPNRASWKSMYVISSAVSDRSGVNQFDFKPIGKAAAFLASALATETLQEDGKLTAEGMLKQCQTRRGGKAFPAWTAGNGANRLIELPPELRDFQFDIRGDNQRWSWQVYRKDCDSPNFQRTTSQQN